jgi:hypothetical protein
MGHGVTVKVRSQAILAWPTAGLEQSGLEALTTQAHTLTFATDLSSFGVARAPWTLAFFAFICGQVPFSGSLAPFPPSGGHSLVVEQ